MANVIDEFLYVVGYKVDKDSEAVLRDSVRTATIQARLITDSMEALAKQLGEVWNKVSENMEQMYYKAQRANMTVSQLQNIGYAAKQTGSSLDEMSGSAEQLDIMLRKNPEWRNYVKDFMHIPLDDKAAMEKAGGQFEAIAREIIKIRNMGGPQAESYAIRLAEKFHISLRQLDAIASPEWEERKRESQRVREMIGVNEKDVGAGSPYEKSVRELQMILYNIWLKFESTFIERFSTVFTGFADFLIAHGEQIANILANIASALIQLTQTILGWLLKIDEFIRGSIGWNTALVALAGFLGLVLTPLGSIVGALGSLAGMVLPSWLVTLLGLGAAGVGLGYFHMTHPDNPGDAGGEGAGGGGEGGGGPNAADQWSQSHAGWMSGATGEGALEPGKAGMLPGGVQPGGVTTAQIGTGDVKPLPAAPGRSPDTQHVDQRLLEVVSAAQVHLPPGFQAEIREGYNPRGHVAKSQHHIAGAGALDIQIRTPQGDVLPNQGGDPSGMYHRFARGAYTEMLARHPELKGWLAWGGAFKTKSGNNDLMHFDVGGERGVVRENWLSAMGPLTQAKAAEAEKIRAVASPKKTETGIAAHTETVEKLARNATVQNDNLHAMAHQMKVAPLGGQCPTPAIDSQIKATTNVNIAQSGNPPTIGQHANKTDKPHARQLRGIHPASG